MGNCFKNNASYDVVTGKIQRSDPAAAARFAREVADTGETHPDYDKLNKVVCWNAVLACAEEHGGLRKGSIAVTAKSWDDFVHMNDDYQIRTAADMHQVPEGSFIGFFDTNYPPNILIMHAMMATGNGMACGNKNSCLGIGRHGGWEMLNLGADEHWVDGSWCIIDSKGSFRNLKVYYRSDW